MIAARHFNDRQGEGPSIMYGVVTTGSLWTFLRLESNLVSIDCTEYNLTQVITILAILLCCVGNDPSSAGAAA